MLQDVGITCNIEVMEFGSFISRTSAGEHDMGYFGWVTSTTDADYTYYSLAVSYTDLPPKHVPSPGCVRPRETLRFNIQTSIS